jgi:hypothetical protein
MKKTIYISVAVIGLLGLMSCGGRDNANNGAAGVNPLTQNQFPTGGFPSGVPGMGVPVQGQACVQGQMRLRGQCYQTADLAQACQWASGQLVQTQGGTMCRSERALGGVINNRLIMVGNYRKDFQINPNLQIGEVLKIYGMIDPNNSDNGWQIQVTQNGTVVGGAQSGAVVADSDQNVLIYIVNQGVANQGYNPGFNTGFGLPGYVISLYGRGTTLVKLRGSAIACENGLGNLYPCQ